MKKLTLLFLLFSYAAVAKFQYTSPINGATLINPEHSIIIRDGRLIDAATIKDNLFSVFGSKSGVHTFKTVFSPDHKTIILYPNKPFSYSEQVTVTVVAGLRTIDAKKVDGCMFTFSIEPEYTAEQKADFLKVKDMVMAEDQKKWGSPVQENEDNEGGLRDFTGTLSIVNNTAPSDGLIFYDAWSANFGGSKYDGYVITNNNGDSIFQSSKIQYCFDFDVNPNGYLSAYNNGHFDVLDSNMTIVDSYYPGNGRTADPHEFTMYPDGHAFMVAEETHFVDMDDYTNGQYHQNATLMTTIIQEFDEDKNVIFEWRAWDHIEVTETNQGLSFSYIDVVHTNSIELDDDGNIIFSNRHLDQINKIDRNTGDFIWRLGGDSNQFTIISDAEGFRYQHCARRLSNGHIMLWDNGNTHAPTHSSAKEYELNLTNMTATLAWSFQPETYSGGNAYFYAGGGIQRLDNGNTMIEGGFESSNNQSNLYEVTANGTVVWEAQFLHNLNGYRVHKRNWNPCAPVNVSSVSVTKITDSTAKVGWGAVSNAASYDLQYRKTGNVNAAWKIKNTTKTKKVLKKLKAGKSYEFQLRTNCLNGYTSDWTPLDTFTTAPARFVNDALDVEELLYPNPAESKINIELNLDEDQTVTILIYNVAGELTLSFVQSLRSGSNLSCLDVASLPSGFYYAEVRMQGEMKTMKFVKE